MVESYETRHTHYHNQSHATYYTHYSYLRFHTSHDSLKIRCYNIGIETNFRTPSQSQHKDAHMDAIKRPYKVAIEIDIDCEELVDACGLEYTRSEQDDTQNVIMLELDAAEWSDVFDQAPLCLTNEQTLGTAMLNHELGEYVTKVTSYSPTGDTITFE